MANHRSALYSIPRRICGPECALGLSGVLFFNISFWPSIAFPEIRCDDSIMYFGRFFFSTIFVLATTEGLLANEDRSLPKFECTSIEVFDVNAVNRILGPSSRPTTSLRSLTSGEWIFVRNSEHVLLKRNDVFESFDPVSNKTSYEVREKTTTLSFELFGTSPSRQGFLWEIKGPLEPSAKIARVTCH